MNQLRSHPEIRPLPDKATNFSSFVGEAPSGGQWWTVDSVSVVVCLISVGFSVCFASVKCAKILLLSFFSFFSFLVPEKNVRKQSHQIRISSRSTPEGIVKLFIIDYYMFLYLDHWDRELKKMRGEPSQTIRFEGWAYTVI